MTPAHLEEPKTPYVAVVDFEATCGDGMRADEIEIIEFAVILAQADWRPLAGGEFCRFVRPRIHPVLSRFCVELTTIPQNEVDWSPDFPEVVASFSKWLHARGIDREEVTFCSWGEFDKLQLLKECGRWDAPYPFSSSHVNLRLVAARQLGLRRNQKQGLAAVALLLGMDFRGTHHRGIDDCRNTLAIMRTLLEQRVALKETTRDSDTRV